MTVSERLLEQLLGALRDQSSYRDVRKLDATPSELSDSRLLDGGPIDGIEVETEGDVVMVLASGREVTRTLTAGRIYPLRVKQIKSTSTTAIGIWGYTL